MTAHRQNVPLDKLSSTVRELVSRTNSNRWERIVSTALGGVILTVGLRRRSLGGAATALIGGWLCYRGISGRSPSCQLFGMRATADSEGQNAGVSADATEIERSITIGESADELHRFWREPQHLSRIVGHVAKITDAGEDRQHWVVPLPLGGIAWNTQVVEECPGEFLRWESLAGAELPNEGAVHFRSAPGDRGTEVTLRVRFDPPGGVLGDAAVTLLDPGLSLLAGTALRRFKSLVETGEIPTLERNPSARGAGDKI